MRKLPIQAFLAMTFTATLASAQEIHRDVSPYYYQLGLGLTSTNEVEPTPTISADFSTGLGFSLLAGRDMGSVGPFGVALEGELYYNFMNVEKGDLPQFTGAGGPIRSRGARSVSLLANVLLDYPIYKDTSWYVGAGLGFAPSVEFDTLDTGNLTQVDEEALVGQFKLGLKWHLGGSSDFLMGYRFLKSESLDVNSSLTGLSSVSLEQHALEFSLRWGM